MGSYKKYTTGNSRRKLRKDKVTHIRSYWKIWDNETKEVIEENKMAYRRWLNTKSIQSKIN
jgi:hypothetical protein